MFEKGWVGLIRGVLLKLMTEDIDHVISSHENIGG